MDELNRVTIAYMKEHPIDFDAYLNYMMSDDWKPCVPFMYKEGSD